MPTNPPLAMIDYRTNPKPIHPTHLQESGLSLEEAESLLRRPYGSLDAGDRYTYILLSQTPEEREAWRQRNFEIWRSLGLFSGEVPKVA